MCGVLIFSPVAAGRRGGSSPHVRGFVKMTSEEYVKMRFIPACAGFCIASSSLHMSVRVHPRMCGVLADLSADWYGLTGSSPHVRGFACGAGFLLAAEGFIPACAGFCPRAPRHARRSKVHPRMCGVLRRCSDWLGTRLGSSPHVRGFEQGRLYRGRQLRFIPACAGFCRRACITAACSEVHPRMCGVLSSMAVS